ncbi:MAG: HmuY family protein [Bacteroidales bacterium]
MKILFIYTSVLMILLSSCFKEDERVKPFPRGNVITRTIGLTQYYTYQIYFDLEDSTEVSTNNKNEWDIGFESGTEGSHIILNSSAFMYIGNSGSSDFEAVNDTTNLDWKYDKSDGDLDSTAVGNWFSFANDDTIYTKPRLYN